MVEIPASPNGRWKPGWGGGGTEKRSEKEGEKRERLKEK